MLRSRGQTLRAKNLKTAADFPQHTDVLQISTESNALSHVHICMFEDVFD